MGGFWSYSFVCDFSLCLLHMAWSHCQVITRYIHRYEYFILSIFSGITFELWGNGVRATRVWNLLVFGMLLPQLWLKLKLIITLLPLVKLYRIIDISICLPNNANQKVLLSFNIVVPRFPRIQVIYFLSPSLYQIVCIEFYFSSLFNKLWPCYI